MAASGSYISPIDPQGYYPFKVFGNFPPSNSIGAKRLAPHKRTSTEDPSRIKSLSVTSGKRGRNRRLAKSLPPLHVTKIPQQFCTHAKITKGQRQLNSGETQRLENRSEVKGRVGCKKWWEFHNTEYKVKPTNFTSKSSHFKSLSDRSNRKQTKWPTLFHTSLSTF